MRKTNRGADPGYFPAGCDETYSRRAQSRPAPHGGRRAQRFSGPQVKGENLRLYFVYFLKSVKVPSHPEGTVIKVHSQTGVARMCEPPVSHAATTEKTGVVETTAPYTLEKLDIGRSESSSGVDSHARWFENGKPLFLKISETAPKP